MNRSPSTTAATLRMTDAQLGMAWFNALTEIERGFWLHKADTAVPADAWAFFKLSTSERAPCAAASS